VASLILADAEAVSCAPRGECTAVGDFTDVHGDSSSFVISEKNGSWGTRRQVPGLGVLAAQTNDERAVDVSCPAAGDCVATGDYSESGPGGYIAEEKSGTWGKAMPIPGLAALSTLQATATTVSCASPGNCAVAGTYHTGTSTNTRVSTFVADESGGTWHDAIALPGLSPLNVGGEAEPVGLACASPGNCTLAGVYAPSVQSLPLPGFGLVYVASEVNGTWRPAARLPGITALAGNGSAMVGSLACPSAGNCVVDGIYAFSQGPPSEAGGAFLASQAGGRWASARSVPGMGTLNTVACQSAGTCTAGGEDTGGRAAVIRETGGTWGKPRELPGAAGLAYKGEKARNSWIITMACPSATDCVVGGIFHFPLGSKLGQEIFLAGESGGTWAAARVPAGIDSLDAGGDAAFGALLTPLSLSDHGLACASVFNCAAAGDYTPPPDADSGVFLLTQTPR
jgi:hypothetical protein